MKISKKQKRNDRVSFGVTFVLFAALMFIAVSLILLFNRNTAQNKIPFDLDSITSDSSVEGAYDIGSYLLPEFIGIILDDQQLGVSGSTNVTTDIYNSFAEVISEVVQKENAKTSTETMWEKYALSSEAVYIRYHSEMPDTIIGTFADLACGKHESRTDVSGYIYEMMMVPGTSLKGDIVLTRDTDGKVMLYATDEPSQLVTSDDLASLLRTYRTQLKKFTFAADSYPAESKTEPIFLENLVTRSIIMSNNIAETAFGNTNTINQLMRVFKINPDKLFTTHMGKDGSSSYTDRAGVFYLNESSFVYKGTEDGGIPVSDLIRITDGIGIKEYVAAAHAVISDIEGVYVNFAGGEADMYLSSVVSDGREITFRFSYAYDNIRIAEIGPAFTVTFKNGVLIYAELYTVAVKNLGHRNECFGEWWFFEHLRDGEIVPQNVGIVYRGDFVSESVSAEWAATAHSSAARIRR